MADAKTKTEPEPEVESDAPITVEEITTALDNFSEIEGYTCQNGDDIGDFKQTRALIRLLERLRRQLKTTKRTSSRAKKRTRK
jgi:hypothetical protein